MNKEKKKELIKIFRIKAGQQYKLFLNSWRDLGVWQQAIFSIGFVFYIWYGYLFFKYRNYHSWSISNVL